MSMVLHTRSIQVAAASDKVYLLLSDVRRLPDYFPPVTAVRVDSREVVGVTVAGPGDRALTGDVELDRDGPETRIGWAVRGRPIFGTVIVQEGPSDVDSILTVTVEDGDPSAPDSGLLDPERTHDAGEFGGAHGREELPRDALARLGEDGALRVGDVLERALDHFRQYVEKVVG